MKVNALLERKKQLRREILFFQKYPPCPKPSQQGEGVPGKRRAQEGVGVRRRLFLGHDITSRWPLVSVGEGGLAHWTVFLSPHSRSCWLMSGSFLQRKMCCPDEWRVCLGTCWKRSWCISKGILAERLQSSISRPAPVASLFSLPTCPPLPSLVTCPPSLQYSTRQLPWQGGKRGGDASAPQQEMGAAAAHRSQDPCPEE